MKDLQTLLEEEHRARREAYQIVHAHASNLRNARRSFAGPDDMAEVMRFLENQLEYFSKAPND